MIYSFFKRLVLVPPGPPAFEATVRWVTDGDLGQSGRSARGGGVGHRIGRRIAHASLRKPPPPEGGEELA